MKRQFAATMAKRGAWGYLIILSTLTAWFLGSLALADPRCSGCSVYLIKWAGPRAELLMTAWFFAGVGYLWFTRHALAGFGRRLTRTCAELLRLRASPGRGADTH